MSSATKMDVKAVSTASSAAPSVLLLPPLPPPLPLMLSGVAAAVGGLSSSLNCVVMMLVTKFCRGVRSSLRIALSPRSSQFFVDKLPRV
jgi:hypothetical protein